MQTATIDLPVLAAISAFALSEEITNVYQPPAVAVDYPDPVAAFAAHARIFGRRTRAGSVPVFSVTVAPQRYIAATLAEAGIVERIVTISALFARKVGEDAVYAVKVHAGRSTMACDLLARWDIDASGEAAQVQISRDGLTHDDKCSERAEALAKLEAIAVDAVALIVAQAPWID